MQPLTQAYSHGTKGSPTGFKPRECHESNRDMSAFGLHSVKLSVPVYEEPAWHTPCLELRHIKLNQSIMATGKINVSADNIFPIIKKFLYSDHEIFLRELISNAVDASNKLKTLANLGEFKGELGDMTVQVHIDKKKKQLRIVDRGIGMTQDEVQKYINDVAFSGAEEFVKQYEGKVEKGAMIGHFGLGFYSSFMVSSKVEIKSLSWKTENEKEGAHWACDGSPEFELKACSRKDRGTEIILHIDGESEDFLEEHKIKELLKKYARFMSIPIQCGEKEERVNVAAEGEEAKYESVKKPDIINETEPAWTKKPSELSDEDYKKFYKALYPYSFEDPLFHIHINVDYPFDLTGILFFPKIKPNMELQKNKIQLYQSQVFITDNVEGIVPDFLTLLHGVIDSKDIPLNVSRSYLQADGNVKKISGHITKKVADKLEEMFKADRADFEAKWKDISMIIEYGMVTEEKFYERAQKFNLFKSVVDDKFYTMEEYLEKISALQTDKEGQRVVLYASNADAQHSYIQKAKAEGYDVILLESPIAGHSIQKFEGSQEKLRFARVDSDLLDKLIPKGESGRLRCDLARVADCWPQHSEVRRQPRKTAICPGRQRFAGQTHSKRRRTHVHLDRKGNRILEGPHRRRTEQQDVFGTHRSPQQ